MIWQRLPDISAEMPYQLALDEVLFRQMEAVHQSRPEEDLAPVLRFYFSSSPWISLGYSEKKQVPAAIPMTRRITGGGRVEHGTDLVFALIALKKSDESFRSVEESYFKVHQAVKTGFEILGDKPAFYQRDQKLAKGPDCFIYPIETDLSLNGQKVAGGAQKRSSGVLLHEESVRVPQKKRAQDLIPAFLEGFQRVFRIKIQNEILNPDWLKQAKSLAREKYTSGADYASQTKILKEEAFA